MRLGRSDEAAAAFERYLVYGPSTSPRWSEAVVNRCRGLLATEDAFDEPFAAGIATHPESDPSGLARTRLCYGSVCAGRAPPRGPRAAAGRARVVRMLRARPWADRCRASSARAASGCIVATHRARGADAAGAADRAPGGDGKDGTRRSGPPCSLSHKTVEFHLAGLPQARDLVPGRADQEVRRRRSARSGERSTERAACGPRLRQASRRTARGTRGGASSRSRRRRHRRRRPPQGSPRGGDGCPRWKRLPRVERARCV